MGHRVFPVGNHAAHDVAIGDHSYEPIVLAEVQSTFGSATRTLVGSNARINSVLWLLFLIVALLLFSLYAVAILIAAYLTLVNASTLAAHEVAAMLFFVTLSLANVGALFEGRTWVVPIELARLATIAVAASAFIVRREHTALAIVVLATCALSALWVMRLRTTVAHRPEPTN
ncbi:MAG: hypothetical protein HC788_13760 [Sphingopyxis sp.]|nr:hypothetical protein [Sphingopyxis sp.]